MRRLPLYAGMRQKRRIRQRKLKQYVPVVEEDLETAEFGEGVMVLPVAYTKGLEFDAVLLLDPTEEKYPEMTGR